MVSGVGYKFLTQSFILKTSEINLKYKYIIKSNSISYNSNL